MRRTAAWLAVLVCTTFPVLAEPPLVVGTKQVPPFAMRGDDGSWTGISLELWRDVAAELGRDYELREMELDELMTAVGAGEIDAAVAALTVTAERERVADFSHAYFTSGLGIATSGQPLGPWATVVASFASVAFLQVVLVLAALLFVVGALVWFFERRRNPEQFGGAAHRGIGSGFWWSAVTMTTVGYGDKAPVSAGGRAVALVWMFASLIIISSFTAAIASALTLGGLETEVSGPDDLKKHVVGTCPGSTSEQWLAGRGLRARAFDTPADALDALEAGEIAAVVYDRPILRYLARNRASERIKVLPHVLEVEPYAIALPPGSELRESLNRALLEQVSRPAWRERMQRYLGD